MSDRFKPPTAADEYSNCTGCGERKHYEALDEDGLCQECQPDLEIEEEMKKEAQVVALAELDGYEYTGVFCTKNGRSFDPARPPLEVNYLNSYDAIIPLIQKQDNETLGAIVKLIVESLALNVLEATPQQLSEALLHAAGKWIE